MKARRIILAILLQTAAWTPAAAQTVATGEEDSEDKAQGVEDIIVTARFRSENLQDTPIAITAISGESLTQSGLTSTSQIGRLAPNAYLRANGQQFGRSLTAYIRGVGQSDFDYAFEPGVAMYIDGIYYSTLLGSAFDLVDIDRIEVLRGPQGTLSGRGAIGGSINLVSRKPEGDNSGAIEITAGSFNRIDAKASFDVPVVPDKLFLRASGVVKSHKGYQKQVDFTCDMARRGTPTLAGNLPSAAGVKGDDCVIGRFGGEDVKAGRIALRALPSDRLEINLSADYTRDTSSAQAASILGLGDVDFATTPPNLIRHTVPGTTTGIPAAYLAWNTLVGIPVYSVPYDARFLSPDPFVSYATYSGAGDVDYDRPSLENWGGAGTVDYDLSDAVHAKFIIGHRGYKTSYAADSDLSPLPQMLTFGKLRHRQTSAELQLTGSAFDSTLDWTLGGYLSDAHSSEKTRVELGAYFFTLNRDNVIASSNRSVFGHLVWSAADALHLSGGLRYSRDEKNFSFDNGFVARAVNSHASRVDWKIGLDFKPTDDMMIYGSVASGYRPASFNPRPYIPSQFKSVDGEELIGYELGAKTSLFDNRVHLNVAGFFSDYKKRIIALSAFDVANNVPDTLFANGPAKIHGVEAELQAEPIDGLRINAAFGYTKFKARDLPLDKLPGVPEFNSAFGIEYEASLGLAGFLTPRVDWFYTSAATFVVGASSLPPPPEDTQPAYSLVNARLTWDAPAKDWSVSIMVSNLFNKFYAETIQDWRALGGTFTGEYQPAAPRQWSIAVRRKF